VFCSQRVQRLEFAGGEDELRGQEVLVVVQWDRRSSCPVPHPDSFRLRPTPIEMNHKHTHTNT